MAETRKAPAARAQTDDDKRAAEVISDGVKVGDGTDTTMNKAPAEATGLGRVVDTGEDKPSGPVLNSGTHLRNPETGEVEFLPAGSTPPKWATDKDEDGHALAGEHLLTDTVSLPRDPSVEVPVDGTNVPPLEGPGSTRPAWAAFASAHGVVVGANATRDDIVDALDAAGIPTS